MRIKNGFQQNFHLDVWLQVEMLRPKRTFGSRPPTDQVVAAGLKNEFTMLVLESGDIRLLVETERKTMPRNCGMHDLRIPLDANEEPILLRVPGERLHASEKSGLCNIRAAVLWASSIAIAAVVAGICVIRELM
jgi:hypothetical protein